MLYPKPINDIGEVYATFTRHPIILWENDDGGTIIDGNQPLLDLLEITDICEVVGKSAWEMMDSKYHSVMRARREIILNGGHVSPERLEIHVNNKKKWVELIGAMVVYQGRSIWVVCITPVANLVRLENELEAEKAKYEEVLKNEAFRISETKAKMFTRELDKSITKATGMVAHELRNPLGTIQTGLYTLRELLIPQMTDRAKVVIDRLDRNIIRCTNIIEDLLDYAKTSAKPKILANLNGVIQQIIDDFHFPTHVDLMVGLNTNITMYVNASELGRALVNIFQNAVDATREVNNPTIAIKTKLAKNGKAYIFVANEGPNIPEGELIKIFTPFYSTKGFGTGLGLPLALRTFRAYNGTLIAKNLKGGVVFCGSLEVTRSDF